MAKVGYSERGVIGGKMHIRPGRGSRAGLMCAALALASGALRANAQTVDAPVDNTVDTPGSAPVGDSTLDHSLSALQQGASAQQGVSVPYNRPRTQRHVDVSARAGATYDSNVIRSNAVRVTNAGLQKDDFLFPVGFSVDAFVPSGANAFSLQGNAGYQFYRRNSRLNSENIALIGGYGRTMRACHAQVDPSFARNRTQLQEGGFGLDTGNLQTTESANVSVYCNVTTDLRPFGSASYLHARNSEARRAYSDHDTKTFGGGVVNNFPALGSIGLVASVEDTDYPDRMSLLGARQLRVKSIGATFSRMTARILQAKVQLNYTKVEDGQVNGSFSGLSGNAMVRFMPGARFTFTLSANRAATPSLEFASDYNLDTSYDLNATAKLDRKLNGRIGYSHVHRKFFGVAALPGLGFTTDSTATYDAGLSYLLLPKVSLNASVVHIKRTSDNVKFNYTDTRSTVGVGVRF